MQALHSLWSATAFSWEQEQASTRISTWFVDHRLPQPHCWRSRETLLFGEFWHWEAQLRGLWNDRLDPSDITEFHIVSPAPLSRTNSVAGHVILIQHARQEWSTTLLTVLDSGHIRTGISLSCCSHIV